MKKRLAILVCVMCAVTLAGCAGDTKPPAATTPDSSAPSSTPAPAAPQEKQIVSIAHGSAEDAAHHISSLEIKKILEEKAGDKLEVQIYPAAQLGSEREMAENMQNGSIVIHCTSPAITGNFIPQANVLDMPFVFTDSAVGRKALADQAFLDILNKYWTQANMRLLGIQDLGFRCLTLNKPVTSLDDIKGVKIRTQENKFHIAIWKALGANPTPLAFNELYTALQQKTVDGQENPIELIYSQKFYEQQKYIIQTNHIPLPMCWNINNDFYESLPDDMQALFNDTVKAGIEVGHKYLDESLVTKIKTMEDKGVTVTTMTADEIAPFREKAESTYPMFKEAIGDEVYNAYLNTVKKYE